MTHREKVKLLVADLSARGVNTFTTAPPIWRLAWALGFELAPPHFVDPRTMSVVGGGLFGPAWGLGMWCLFWRAQGLLYCLLIGIPAGIMFGRLISKRYRAEAERLNLPPTWAQYPGP